MKNEVKDFQTEETPSLLSQPRKKANVSRSRWNRKGKWRRGDCRGGRGRAHGFVDQTKEFVLYYLRAGQD